jgi:hypothetical protein
MYLRQHTPEMEQAVTEDMEQLALAEFQRHSRRWRIFVLAPETRSSGQNTRPCAHTICVLRLDISQCNYFTRPRVVADGCSVLALDCPGR